MDPPRAATRGVRSMRISRPILIRLGAVLLLQIASDVCAQMAATKLSCIGYIDYRNQPQFKVGDWVKYRFTSKSDGGGSEDHDLTLLVSGEEKFWGDDCFW